MRYAWDPFGFSLMLFTPVLWAACFSWLKHHCFDRPYFLAQWLWIASVDLALMLVYRDWDYTGAALSALIALIWWWWDSGHRKRTAKLLGSKARAIRDRMARRMRQLPPRPVLVPS